MASQVIASASTSVSASSSSSSSSKTTRRLNILTIPVETQQAIFSHCSKADLVTLSVVSKSFHELAAAELYRSFEVTLPSENHPRFREPRLPLTGALDTLTTSDYHYARFLRRFAIDTQAIGDKARSTCQQFSYSTSGGRLLNTLLHLALRDAHSLEAFKWNLRVELSRPVFKTLHQLPALQDLHIRLQGGPSLYEPPRPLPLANVNTYQLAPPPPPPPPHPHPQNHPPTTITWAAPIGSVNNMNNPLPPNQGGGLFNGLGPFALPQYVPPTQFVPAIPPAPLLLTKSKNQRNRSRDPPTLSAFKNLKRLAILDIDSLDIIPEIRAAIENSETTLTHVSLSFSAFLAKKARETSQEPDSDGSGMDDEFQPAENSTSFDASGPVRPARAQKEWKIQETVLARLFGLTKAHGRRHAGKGLDSNASNHLVDDNSDPTANGGKNEEVVTSGQLNKLVNTLKAASGMVLDAHETQLLAHHHQKILDAIGKAVSDYVESDALKTTPKGSAEGSGPASGSASASGSGFASGSKEAENEGQSSQTVTEPVSGANQEEPDSAPSKTSNPKELDDIDIADSGEVESLGGDDDEDDADPATPEEEGAATTETSSAPCPSAEQSDGASLQQEADIDATRPLSIAERSETEKKSLISSYVKSTRGLGLQSLAIHLIPVKPSVISQALDVHVLRSLTLLNVGNQAPIWALLSKENQVQSLALRDVFTDHVSTAFIKCIEQLDELHNLFMLERSSKYRPATFVNKTNVSLSMIRKRVFRKHLPTLKRLMIRNDNKTSWDLDSFTILLLCQFGRRLEELSAGFAMRSLHVLLQHFARLRNLRALHISPFRNDDTCVWAIQETTRFFTDALAQHPYLGLEWLAVENRLTHITRNPRPAFLKKRTDQVDIKGKGKAVSVSDMTTDGGWTSDSSTSSSSTYTHSDNDSIYTPISEAALKLRTRNFMMDYVGGVRIFEKEIRAGEL